MRYCSNSSVEKTSFTDEYNDTYSFQKLRRTSCDTSWLSAILATVGIVSLTVSVFIQLHSGSPQSGESPRVSLIPSSQDSECEHPELRREWRTLTSDEQRSYVSAVLCLNEQASRLDKKHPLSADFPYAHIWYARDVHDGVRFLAYHRWFIHLYETALREECGYQGRLVYWDWTQDWAEPYAASVFDKDDGFGSNGNIEEPGYVGYCIEDGPFRDYTTPYKNERHQPHCLSRNFTFGRELEIWKAKWHPREMERVLKIENWIEFNEQVERGMHLAMPWLIGGDFKTQGSPAEPLFFLHHVQLDRILWMWQKRDPETRIHASFDDRGIDSGEKEMAKFKSGMFFGDLGPVVSTIDVMDIQGDKLCYRY